MHSVSLIIMVVLLSLVWCYLKTIHRVLGYTHAHQYCLSVRGMRVVVLVCILLMGYELIQRHVLITGIGV